MKATEMLKQVKDLLGMDVKAEVVLSEETQEENIEETQLESQETEEVQEETLSEDKVEETQDKVELATAELENGTIVEAEAFEAGNEIFIVTEDERVALPIGEYSLADGQILTIEEEGIIASIGAATEETEEVEAAADYATKEELAEVKKAVEDIVTMIEELGYGKKEEEMSSEETKEELSSVEKVKHNPETEDKTELNLYAQNRQLGVLDRVMNTISNFN
jgi:hypothetical protein